MTKISALPEDTSISDDDILYKVDDPSGSPLSRKITWANIKAVLKTYFDTLYEGVLWFTPEDVSNKSTDTALWTSDTLYPSQKAVKTYADNLVAWLLDYRGAYDASVNTFPTTWWSWSGWAVLKWDMWIISVAWTLWWEAVQIWDSIISNVDTPWQTSTNWDILNSNISYVPEDVANKSTDVDADKASDTKYSSTKSIYDWAVALFANIAWDISQTFSALTIELWHATDTTISRVSVWKIAVEWINVVTVSSVDTLLNKRITTRINTIASSATPTPAWDTTDEFTVTALAAAATFAAPTWTPTEGQVLLIRIKDDATARALSWNAIYRASSDLALPTTTIVSKTLYLQFVYNNTDSKWDLLWLLDNF